MKNKNDGKSFEKLVAVIHEAYKESGNTKIYTNHKIKDKFSNNKYREFDVFIITKVNNIDFQIAIECKDYDKPVSVEKIEAFNSKCSTIKGINKKIMVSPKGFQSGAIENAEHFDIELYTLSEFNKSIFVDWIDTENIKYLTTEIVLIDYNIDVINETFGTITLSKATLNDKSKIRWVNNELLHPTALFEKELCSFMSPEMGLALLKESKKRGSNNFDIPVSIEETFNVTPLVNFQPILINNGIALTITAITARLKASINQVENSSNVEVKSYDNILKIQQGELVSAKFNDNISLNFYKSAGEKEEKAVLIENEKITPLIRGFKINPDTGKS